MVRSATAIEEATGATIDPVCGMTVPTGKRDLIAEYQGHIYYFCADACRKAFEKNPDQFLECQPAKRKNWFMRWLDQLAESNRKEFGGKPKCH